MSSTTQPWTGRRILFSGVLLSAFNLSYSWFHVSLTSRAMTRHPAFIFCMIISTLCVAAAALSDPMLWEMNYYDSGIFFWWMLPLAALAVAIFCLPVLIGLMFLWFLIFRRKGIALLIPLAISLAAVAVGLFVNTTGWWLMYNDWRFGKARAELFSKVIANPPQGGAEEYFGIPVPGSSGSHLSLGDGPAYFKMTDKGPLVLFVTFAGIPDGFSGFLYAPADIDPKQAWPDMQFEWSDAWDKDRHIYFVGNR
ncbi:hypothetical protein [Aestuariivirga sp.]|uniref:hypothetical protein n=1 Tax=Aestuariivirga sp. TaxID=2650926 RepID=UPI0039E5CA61